MSEHAILAPSSAPIWGVCEGSVTMQQQYPETDLEKASAVEGSAAHWVGSETLEGREPREGQLTPFGLLVDEEMLDGAGIYIEHIIETLGAPDLDSIRSRLHVESRVYMPEIHAECWGTPDCWSYNPAARILDIWDYKYGHGKVEAFENFQLVAYFEGVFTELGLNGVDDQNLTVRFHVVQPRCYVVDGPVRTWTVTAAKLRALVIILRMQAGKALSPNPKCHVNPGCKHCTARRACTTLQQASAGACDVAGDAIPHDLPPYAVGAELRDIRRAQAILEARETGLAEQALILARQGENIPFFRVEQTSGREAWKVPPQEVIAVGLMLGKDIAKPPAPVTPAQARKAGIPPDLVEVYSERKPGAVKLVPDSTQRMRSIFRKD